jgi:hypothetical protein
LVKLVPPFVLTSTSRSSPKLVPDEPPTPEAEAMSLLVVPLSKIARAMRPSLLPLGPPLNKLHVLPPLVDL